MARDYKNAASSRGRKAPAKSGLPGWLMLIVGGALGFGVAFGFNVGKSWWIANGPDHRPPAQASNTPKPDKSNGKTSDTAAQGKSKPDDGKPRFDFYKMLPNFEIVVPDQDKEVQSSGEVAKLDKPGSYVLQVGSFRDHADADQLKASLALQGIRADIQQVKVDSNQTWNRVRIGPYSDLDKINRIRKKLQANGLEALIIRMND